jgi:hypothetical protein
MGKSIITIIVNPDVVRRRDDSYSPLKLGPPKRKSCVSKYEKFLPCSNGSSVKSIPGTMFIVQYAICSVSGKNSSGFLLSVSLPTI